MNATPDNPLPAKSDGAPAVVDETLRLISHVPVPAGLTERVHAALLEAAPPKPAPARVLAWPVASRRPASWTGSGWMRAVAAAAIVFVVAGGGWGVYQRVERPTAKVIVMPVVQPSTAGGFSSAGAIRTPQTVTGPVLVQPAATLAGKKSARKKARKITPAQSIAPAPSVTAQPVSAVAGGK